MSWKETECDEKAGSRKEAIQLAFTNVAQLERTEQIDGNRQFRLQHIRHQVIQLYIHDSRSK
jgi:hypothetical protein